jgi:hypothetical protein
MTDAADEYRGTKVVIRFDGHKCIHLPDTFVANTRKSAPVCLKGPGAMPGHLWLSRVTRPPCRVTCDDACAAPPESRSSSFGCRPSARLQGRIARFFLIH